MSSRNQVLPIDAIRKISKFMSATRYINHVEMDFDWESESDDWRDPVGVCFAYVQITWDTRIESSWKVNMKDLTREILHPVYDNDLLHEIQEKYENTDVELAVVDPDGTDENGIAILIQGSYEKDEEAPDDLDYNRKLDFGSDRGKKIKREFKQYVWDAMTSLMKSLLSPPDTPMQPVVTLDNYGDEISYDDNEDYDSDDVDVSDDYKLETTDVFFEKYWIDLFNGEYIVKQNAIGKEYKAFKSTFGLLNNKRIPLSRGVSGIVVRQYKLKF